MSSLSAVLKTKPRSVVTVDFIEDPDTRTWKIISSRRTEDGKGHEGKTYSLGLLLYRVWVWGGNACSSLQSPSV